MKNIIIGTGSLIILFLTLFIVTATYGRNIRRTELENALNNGLETAMEMLMENQKYAPKSNEELIADFNEAFFMQINSTSDITVNVLAVDYEKGLLSVEVVSEFPYLNGGTGSVAVQKTIIMDYYQEEKKKMHHTISFKVNGEIYRTYQVQNADACIIPPEPEMDGKIFVEWKEVLTEETYKTERLGTLLIEDDIEFHAIFE